MDDTEKSRLIELIIRRTRLAAKRKGVAFDAGDLFLALAFRTDDELKEIAKACGA